MCSSSPTPQLIATDLEALSNQVFANPEDRGLDQDHRETLRQIGRTGNLSGKAKDSLLNLRRVGLFLSTQARLKKDAKARLKVISRDIVSITEHANFIANKVTFLLDATLGMISLEQNNIIKIFSVAAAAFLPPTLIASIYGMNFEFMPELGWEFGYPVAIGHRPDGPVCCSAVAVFQAQRLAVRNSDDGANGGIIVISAKGLFDKVRFVRHHQLLKPEPHK